MNSIGQLSNTEFIVNRSDECACSHINSVMSELGIEDKLSFGYTSPIFPGMAFANTQGVFCSPLLTVDMELIPEELRPKSSDDPRLYDLEFIQNLSDWLAKIFNVKSEPVSVLHMATCKVILRLRENPKQFQLAIRAGIAHELAHVILHKEKMNQLSLMDLKYRGWKHVFNPYKWVEKFKILSLLRKMESEADHFAATNLREGVEGIVIGFRTWQNTLIELRKCKKLSLQDRLILKFLISPKGTPLPLILTHGSFDQRIKKALQIKTKAKI